MATEAQKESQKDWAGDAQNASTDGEFKRDTNYICLLYTSDAADDLLTV